MTNNKMKFPTEVMIEATNCCNNKCFFCGSTVSKRKRGFIEPNLMFRLIEEAYKYGARKISFHGMGEPLLCKELADYVELAKRIGYNYIYLDTNGILATPDKIESVLDAGLDSLKFSIHATTPETYQKITQNDVYNIIFNNFVNVHNYIKRQNIKCKLISYFAENTINTHEKNAFKKIYEKYSDEVWIHPIHNGSGVMESNEKYAVIENIVTMNTLPCKDLQRMIINWEGHAIACCTDWTGSLIYGDANMDDLNDIWNNENIIKIRQQHQNYMTLSEVCKKCMGV